MGVAYTRGLQGKDLTKGVLASKPVLTDPLRGGMGFTGTTVSDYVAVGFLHNRQKVAGIPEEGRASSGPRIERFLSNATVS